MNSKIDSALAAFLLFPAALAFPGCDLSTPAAREAQKLQHEVHTVPGVKAAHPAYPTFIRQIESQQARMHTLLEGGQLDQMYAAAEQIGQLAKLLPTVTTDLPPEAQADIRTQVQNLQGLFMPLTVASKNGDREEAARVLELYDAPIKGLKAYM
jgi:hypothetical protein